MNLKAPIYFSTGLTEKVLNSEMELMYKLVLFDQLGKSNVFKTSDGLFSSCYNKFAATDYLITVLHF